MDFYGTLEEMCDENVARCYQNNRHTIVIGQFTGKLLVQPTHEPVKTIFAKNKLKESAFQLQYKDNNFDKTSFNRNTSFRFRKDVVYFKSFKRIETLKLS